MCEETYLIHAESDHGPKHYIGYSTRLAVRIHNHRRTTWARYPQIVDLPDGRRKRGEKSGEGATIVGLWNSEGIPWKMVKKWPGGWDKEKQLKARKNAARLCPVCRGEIRFEDVVEDL